MGFIETFLCMYMKHFSPISLPSHFPLISLIPFSQLAPQVYFMSFYSNDPISFIMVSIGKWGRFPSRSMDTLAVAIPLKEILTIYKPSERKGASRSFPTLWQDIDRPTVQAQVQYRSCIASVNSRVQ